ncbi:MAG: hypothetical protein BM557_08415 [Flavobacterium sp. MedPE-SWcel]|uniref:T9SS type A sorting domain-containing protein n=1 Tax=uncultured Flavobacterium sp. TaxID=165435 RepID=UPI00091AB255|nr:T9SS type A sorting domain-containing protein [uncultured Flavobacterium sp.]OIQ17700.1 MAG: hypothetical protein BM557_08415 [Flavobacterium sp. MedPE-SWcel]
MKRKILLLCGVFSLFSFQSIIAQEYEPLEITSGLNADVIANGLNPASASTTASVDNADYAFMSTDFQATGSSTPPSYALPLDGVIESGPTAGLSFELADYSSNNSLRIHGTAAPAVTTGTLVFANQIATSKIYILTTSGSGSATMTSVINFTDDTSQTITGSNIPDWFYSNALPIAASGFGRVQIPNNNVENPAGNPRMYQLALDIDAANQTKQIESIQFTKTSSAEGVINVFAVTAEILQVCSEPSDLSVTSETTSATATWLAPEDLPEGGYDYYYSTSDDAPTEATVPSGNVDTTMLELTDLSDAEMYYLWVRSHCSDSNTSAWITTTFTTSELEDTYTEGDINTSFNVMPTVTSTTDCAGTMSVTVPDGYQIASISTAYTMTTANDGFKSQQRSLLVCTTTATTEEDVTAGTGDEAGTQEYNRTDLTFANGATGDVDFELRAWRTFGGTDCNSMYNKVDNNSWTITVNYECVTPLTPQAEDQSFCSEGTVADLVADTDYDNAILKWYADEAGGEPLTEDTALEEGTYYVSQYRYTCESERQAVEVIFTANILPTAEAMQSICTGGTVTDLMAEATIDEATIAWYTTEDGEEVLNGDIALEEGAYFVSQTVGECESERVEVTVTLTTTAMPTAMNEQTYCDGATIEELSATALDDASLNWYATGDSTDSLEETEVLETGSYFVSQTLEGCESDRVEITVTINDTPDTPEGNAIQGFDDGDTVATLTIITNDEAIINWYVMNNESELVSIDDTEVLVDGETYYVSQTIGDCESDTLAITVDVALATDSFEAGILKVFPNPATDVINITNDSVIERIEIINLLGQSVLNKEVHNDNAQVTISNLATGAYILSLQLEGGVTKTVKIIRK